MIGRIETSVLVNPMDLTGDSDEAARIGVVLAGPALVEAGVAVPLRCTLAAGHPDRRSSL